MMQRKKQRKKGAGFNTLPTLFHTESRNHVEPIYCEAYVRNPNWHAALSPCRAWKGCAWFLKK